MCAQSILGEISISYNESKIREDGDEWEGAVKEEVALILWIILSR